MKKLQLLLVSVAMLSIFSCSDDDDDTLGVWYRRSYFDGRAREDAAGFVIGNRGYLCGGYRGKDLPGRRHAHPAAQRRQI